MDRNELRNTLCRLIDATAKMATGKLEASGCYSHNEIIEALNLQSSGELATFFAVLREAKKLAREL